jgi:hypothetical protein
MAKFKKGNFVASQRRSVGICSHINIISQPYTYSAHFLLYHYNPPGNRKDDNQLLFFLSLCH